MQEDIENLMARTSKGDQTAFRHLAVMMGPKMFGFAYRLMNNNPDRAEDAVQDALIKIWISAPNWKPTGKVETYMMTILHHTCMDLHRKERPSTPIPLHLASSDDSVPEQLIKKQSHDRLMKEIDRLPERQRTAVLLSYFGNESNRKIADMLKISEGAVESLLVRARKTLARQLPEDLHASRQKGD